MNQDQERFIFRLSEAGISTRRFLKLIYRTKRAYENAFQNNLYTPEELIQAGNLDSWGICGKDGFVPVDSDKKEMYEILSKILPDTLEVMTPRRKIPQKYFKVTNGQVPNKTLCIPGDVDEKGRPKGAGEIRSENEYVVAAGTTINYKDLITEEPKVGTYKIFKDQPIATIDYDVFMEAVKPYLGEDTEQHIDIDKIRNGVSSGFRHFYGIRMACYLIGVQRLDKNSAFFALKLWNERCQPPMSEKELDHIIDSAEGYMTDTNPLDKQNSDLAKFATDPMLLKQILLDLDRTVKNDIPSKTTVLMTGLSAYAKAMNLSFKSESGSGKTYISTEVIDYFPQEDVWLIGDMTPKALIREKGVLMNAKGEPITIECPTKPNRMDYRKDNKFDKESYEAATKQYKEDLDKYLEERNGSYNLIDLTGKILLFLETPSADTISMLKPILSHDKPEILYKFVDKSKNGPMRTINAKIKGWPATVFLTVDKWHMEEFATRTFTVSPSIDSEKIFAAQEVIDNKDSQPWLYDHDSEIKTATKELLRKLKEILQKDSVEVIIPFPNLRSFFSQKSSTQVRDMRDYDHYKELVRGFAILHLFQRPIIKIKNKFYLLAAVSDPIQAKEIFDQISETTKTSTDQRVLDFYNNIIAKNAGATVEEITKIYNDANSDNPLSDNTIWKYLKRLTKINFVESRKGEKEDKRKATFYPLKKTENSGFSENPLDLKVFLENDFKTWLETNVLQGITFDSKIMKITELENKDIIVNDCPLAIEDVEQLIFNFNPEGTSKISFSEPEKRLNSEIKPKTNGLSKKPIDAINNSKKQEPTGKPQYSYCKIPQAEKCDHCSDQNVEYIIMLPSGDIQRKCENCFKKLHNTFKEGANFVSVEPSFFGIGGA